MNDLPHRSKRLLLASACALANAAASGDEADEPRVLDQMVVTATRTELASDLTGSAVTVIDGLAIQQSGARQVLELFSRVPGLYAFETGGYGGTTSVRLRGADSDQTLVLIDGVRVNDVGSAQGDFDFSSLLVTDNIERIEIVRGPQSALWGGDAIGGVINIITRRGRGPLSGTVELEGGSFETFRAGGSVNGGNDRGEFSLAASALTTEGFSRVARRLGATEDDGTDSWTLTGRGGFQVNDLWRTEAVLQASSVDAETDPNLSGAVDGDAASERTVVSGRWTQHLTPANGALSHELTLFGQLTDREFFDATDDLPTSTFEGSSLGAEYLARYTLAYGTLIGGLRTQHDEGEGDRRSASERVDQFDASFDTHSLFVQGEGGPGEDLRFTLGGRHDDFEIGGGHTTWRAAVSKAFPTTGTRLRASVGTGAKAPTIYQAFFDGPEPIFGTTLIGNRDLEVETSEGFDLTVEQTLADGRARLAATYYEQDIEDLIQFELDFAAFTSTYVNVDQVEIEGWELEASWQALDALAFTANYTLTDAVDASNGLALARTPEDQASVRADFTDDRLVLGVQATYVGEQFNRSRERDLLDSFVRVDVNASWNLDDRWQLFLRIENLLDEEYEVVRNAGVAPLSGYAGVRLRW